MNEIFTKEAFNKPLEDMRPAQATVLSVDASVAEALSLMLQKNIGSVLLKDNSCKLSGIFTDRDLLTRVGNTNVELEKLPIKNVMTSSPFTMTLKTPINQALELVVKKQIRHLPVIPNDSSSENAFAIISARDILRFIVECFPESVASLGCTRAEEVIIDDAHDDAFMQDLQEAGGQYLNGAVFSLPLKKVIGNPPIFLPPETSIDIVYERMIKAKAETVLVVEYGTTLLGIFTERDFMTKVIGKNLWGQNVPITSVMSGRPVTLMPRHKIAYAINNMFKFGHRHVPIVDEEKCPVGSISVLEILHFIYHRIYSIGTQNSKGI